MFFIYAKQPEEKKFYPMNLRAGGQAKNKINATMIEDEARADDIVRSLNEDNSAEGWVFEKRKV